MEFVNGVKEKRVLDIREVLEGEYEGKEIRMNGAVHTIRHMGEVAFVILRKSRGLVQCVYEAGITDFDIRELKEESVVVHTDKGDLKGIQQIIGADFFILTAGCVGGTALI